LRLEVCWEARDLATVSGGADWWWLGRVLGLLRIGLGVEARVRAEVCRLVHVVPETIDVNTSRRVEERSELLVPVLLCVGMEPVREYRGTWPDSTLKERAVGTLLKHVKRSSVVVAVVVTTPDGGVDHHNVVLLVSVDVINELADKVKRVTLRIQGEQAAELHVVNIRPHSLDNVSENMR
jgi:hypothetical protein